MQSLVVLKHADSVDRGYAHDWIDLYAPDGKRTGNVRLMCNGKIRRITDAALPRRLPNRKADKQTWLADPPLTSIGILTTIEVGKDLRANGYGGDHFGSSVYCSPCMCCIETAAHLSYGMQCQLKVRIEPSIANWRSQHHFAQPAWAKAAVDSYDKVATLDKDYKSVIRGIDWNPNETISQLVKRVKNFIDVLETKHEGKIALLIGHGCTISAVDKALCPDRVWTYDPISWVTYFRHVPRLASTRYEKTGKGWQYQQSFINPFPHFANGSHNWKLFE